MRTGALAGALSLGAGAALAAGPIEAGTIQPTNWNAIIIFLGFVVVTLGITYWAAQHTRTTKDFYAAGGGITGFQNGLAIAGDYMSAASFLGIVALVYAGGYYGLIYSIGFLVGWPFIMFLMAEPLRNLGRFTFADVASYRLQATPIRAMAATGSLVTVLFYLIAQMVGAGQLIQLLFGLPYLWAVVIVGVLMIIYVTFGGMIATTWVQIIKAALLLGGSTLMALLVLAQFGFDFNALIAKAVEVHPGHDKILTPGAQVANPINAISLGMALMFGTAGLPHILMRFFTVGNAKEARKSVFWATTFIGYFYILTFILGFGAIVLVSTNPVYHVGDDIKNALLGGGNMPAIHLAQAVGGDLMKGFIAAVAFATILAVVSGLTLSGASAVSHDLYASVFRRGNVDEAAEVRVLADYHRRSRHRGGPSRNRVRENQCRLHGGPRLRGGGERQLPGASALHAVEGTDHPRRLHRRLRRADQRACADNCQPWHLGSRVRLSEGIRVVSLRVAGAVHHPAVLLLLLGVLGHRQLEDGRGGKGGLRGPVRPVANRNWRGHCGRALIGRRGPRLLTTGARFRPGALFVGSGRRQKGYEIARVARCRYCLRPAGSKAWRSRAGAVNVTESPGAGVSRPRTSATIILSSGRRTWAKEASPSRSTSSTTP